MTVSLDRAAMLQGLHDTLVEHLDESTYGKFRESGAILLEGDSGGVLVSMPTVTIPADGLSGIGHTKGINEPLKVGGTLWYVRAIGPHDDQNLIVVGLSESRRG